MLWCFGISLCKQISVDVFTITVGLQVSVWSFSASEMLLSSKVQQHCDFFLMSKNRIRQNLREKHARHIADLRAYYDSEIQSLKQQLEPSHKSPSEDLKKINQNLVDR